MAGNEPKHSAISHATSLEEMGAFWDTHDFTDYDTDAPDVEIKLARVVPIEAALLQALRQQAQQRGVTVETLVNLWLQQKLIDETRSAA